MRSILLASLLFATPAIAQDGSALYKRCAACHLPTGAGVPGAFPPFRADFAALSMKPEARRYLALSVIRGVSGPITIDGKPYRGVMPAQAGMNDAQVAAVLNYIAVALAKAGKSFKPFTEAEVKAARAAGAGLTSAAVGQLHARAGGK